jgi:putative membrane protein
MTSFKALSVLLLAAASSVSAFAPVAPNQAGKISISRASTEVYSQTQTPPPLPPIRDISYGEESRKFRRTIFTHDDWINFRSPDRFWRNLQAMASSGVYKNMAREVTATTSVAALVCLYNGLVGGFQDLNGQTMEPILNSPVLPVIGLPLAPFTLSSPSLGLLLSKCLNIIERVCSVPSVPEKPRGHKLQRCIQRG